MGPKFAQSQSSGADRSPQTTFAPPDQTGAAPTDPNLLVQLEMLRVLRGMQNDQGSRREPEEDEDWKAKTSLGKAAAGMRRHKTRLKSRPKAVIDEFRDSVLEGLNVKPGQPWSYVDMHKTVPWGQYRSLQRCYILMMNIIEHLDNGDIAQGTALACQSSKAIQQCALQQGNWKVAWGFTGLHDPLTRRTFAGSLEELEVVADWLKAEEEIHQKARKGVSANLSDQESDDGSRRKSKAEKKAAGAAAKAKASAVAKAKAAP